MHKPEDWRAWYKCLENNTSVTGIDAQPFQEDNTNAPFPKIDINNTIGNDVTILTADAINTTGLLTFYLSLTNISDVLKDFLFFLWAGLRDPIACSLLSGGSPSHNSGYKSTRLCPSLC